MRKFLILFLIALISLGTSAQRRKRVQEPTPEELAEQARKEKYDRNLQAIERVTFIDSMLLSKKGVLDALSLGSENGSVHTYSEFFDRRSGRADDLDKSGQDTLDCTLFQTQLGDKIIYSQPGNDTILHLFASEMIAGKWTSPVMLPGLKDTVDQNYPFLLSDGVTLYYASKDEAGLGGYDIYMTRWDADNKKFLKPENIGMPFNSEANDYLYVIDEFNHLGWFATDRGYSGDTVCLYCFIPNEVRRIYNANELGRDTLVAFANISSIRDTWTDESAVNEALDKLEGLRHNVKKTRKADFLFVVNDKIVYTHISQFRHSESARLAEKWIAQTKEKDSISRQLEAMRLQYLTSDVTTKATLKSKLLALEQQYEQLIPSISQLEREIRAYEQR